jgi:hypothetical protein
MTISVWPGLFGKAFQVRDNKELEVIESFRADQLVPMIKQFARDGQFASAETFVESFANHGFCATGQPDEANGGDYGSADLFRIDRLPETKRPESLHMPRIGAPRTDRRGRVVDAQVWRPFRPGEWRPYASRSRWFRTPNDVFMTVNNKASVVEEGALFGILDLSSRGSSGAFHPSAEGHAAIADSVTPALVRALAMD